MSTPRIPKCIHILACSNLRPHDDDASTTARYHLGWGSALSLNALRDASLRLWTSTFANSWQGAFLRDLFDQMPYAVGTFLDTDGRTMRVPSPCTNWGVLAVSCAGSLCIIFMDTNSS